MKKKKTTRRNVVRQNAKIRNKTPAEKDEEEKNYRGHPLMMTFYMLYSYGVCNCVCGRRLCAMLLKIRVYKIHYINVCIV